MIEWSAMDPFLLSQALAASAFLLGLLAVQFKGRRTILLCLFLCTLLNSAHFFVLARPGAAALLIITAVRYLTAAATTRRPIMFVFLVITIAAALVTFRSPLSLIALAAVVLGTIGSFQESNRAMRLFLMAGNTGWLLHNILSLTPVGVIMEASFLASNVIGYCRHCRSDRERH
ncbi:MAG: YgjV family protein [Pirellulaceae bacterium]|jgi:hypothetical protein|nr:YgjV family protein [Pirellulaceae bacterium]MDP7020326.1 YgjV family protein [Pirellulaceae bacterium]